MTENEITYAIRGGIFKVYNAFEPGLFESVYQAALAYELKKEGLSIKTQVPIPVFYDGVDLGIGFLMDILVEDKIIVEVKSIKEILDVHHKQVITYLRLSEKKLGLLVNFNSKEIENSIYRKVNGL